jgi:putative transposase
VGPVATGGGGRRTAGCGCGCASWPSNDERFGYRRLQVLLVREGWQVNHKRVYRLYVEEKLGLRRKPRRRRAPGAARVVLAPPTAPDQVWTMDFTHDAFAGGSGFGP